MTMAFFKSKICVQKLHVGLNFFFYLWTLNGRKVVVALLSCFFPGKDRFTAVGTSLTTLAVGRLL